MPVRPDQVIAIVQTVWRNMLATEVRGAPAHGKNWGEKEKISGSVPIHGSWEGTVTLVCSVKLASQLAAIMFGIEPDTVSTEDRNDALGELANMTAGSYKTLVSGSGEAELGLPVITHGKDFELSFPGAKILYEVGFNCLGYGMSVTVAQKPAGQKAA